MKNILNKITFFLFLFSVIISVNIFIVSPAKADETVWKIPNLEITISDKIFSEAKCVKNDKGKVTSCEVPWIYEYIVAIYKYAVGVVGIIAVIVMMLGGVTWITAGGNPTRVGEAKSWITASVTGLVLVLCSYTILYYINPAIIQNKYIKIGQVQDEYEIPESDITGSTATYGAGKNGVPLIFQTSPEGQKIIYGNCEPPKTVAQTGCGLVSTMMVMGTYGTTPNMQTFTDIAVKNGARVCGSGSSGAGLMKAAAEYGYTGKTLNGIEDIKSKLKDARPVIISLHGPCVYTKGGHFIVLTGCQDSSCSTANVNDPNNASNNPARTSISLDTLSGCTLNQAFYIYK